jgi:hypothetical protein
MMAFWLNWLTVTLAPPWPWTFADPPTTCAPSGPASAGEAATARSAVEIRRRFRRRIVPVS